MRLEALERAMVAAIDHGPDHIVEAAFLGGRAAALRGLAVHANTISHARLVAIEDTFPRTRKRLGHGAFNALSRRYVERSEVTAEPLSTIGRHFSAFLGEHGLGEAAALAAFEWAWLEAYHAQEGDALDLAGLAGRDQDELLRTVLARHPAARLTEAPRDDDLASEVPGLADAPAILVTRPHADVLVSPATQAMARQFEILREPRTVCNLLECSDEPGSEDNLRALFAMLGAGSLVLT